MEREIQQRVAARNAATRLQRRLTTGIALGALAGFGLLSWIFASINPGASTSSGPVAISAVAPLRESDDAGYHRDNSDDNNTGGFGGFSGSAPVINSSNANPVAVTGGSHP
jgi:hypothetical protein